MYPRATLENKSSLSLCDMDLVEPGVIQKYQERGFTFILTCSHEYDDAFLVDRVRWLGDSMCWRIPLATSSSAPDFVIYSSWCLVATPEPQINFNTLSGPSLDYVYVVGDRAIRDFIVVLVTLTSALPEQYR